MRIIPKTFPMFTMVLCVLSAGCATIVSDKAYHVTIDSDPQGAEGVVRNRDGEHVFTGTTPFITPALKAGAGYLVPEDYTVTFSKEGFMPHIDAIEWRFDPWYIAGNFFLPIGYFVDPHTGAMWKLKDLSVELQPQNTAGPRQ